VALHAKYALRGSRVSKVLNLALAIPATEAVCTEGLVARKYCEILDLLVAGVAAISALVANETAVPQEQKIRIRVQRVSTGVAFEAVDVPSIAGCADVSNRELRSKNDQARIDCESLGRERDGGG
jgi:hypothetical protein